MTEEVIEEPWIYNGVEFKVGERVLVAYKGEVPFFTEGGMGAGDDWQNVWVPAMNYAVGGVHEIESIEPEGVEFVQYVDEGTLYPHGGFRYPLSVLVKVQ